MIEGGGHRERKIVHAEKRAMQGRANVHLTMSNEVN